VDIATFWLPKQGNSEAEYEDAFWPNGATHNGRCGGRFAAADGATESSFAGLWARLLVRGFGRRKFGVDSLPEYLPALQRVWLRLVRRRPLPWYAEMALENGAHAAFLGLEADAPASGESAPWRALAAGDACLFQVGAGERLESAFPIVRAEDFGSRPHLLSSQPRHNAVALPHLAFLKGVWQAGDSLYLLTDAIAAWFLRAAEIGERPWETLSEFHDPEAFRDWVEARRTAHEMRNDDVTMLRILA
jgi:hypothetical protein